MEENAMKLTPAKKVLLSVVILLIAAVVVLMSIKPPKVSYESIDISAIDDGAYMGAFTFGPVKAVVEVTISSGIIAEVAIREHRTGQGQKAEGIIDSVIAAQSLEVDEVSGATWSSRAILKAVEAALKEAKDGR